MIKLSAKEAKRLGYTAKPGKRAKVPKGESAERPLFLAACQEHGLPPPLSEYHFAVDIGRKWRFDYFWKLIPIGCNAYRLRARGVALEVDGGSHSGGRHTRAKGFRDDQEKRNNAVLRGIWVLNCTPEDVTDGSVFALLKKALCHE